MNAECFDSSSSDGSNNRVLLFDDMSIERIGIDFELQARESGYRNVAGVDEVGRGCLAGPVVAAACVLDIDRPLPEGLDDSKKLSPAKREKIGAELKANCIAYAIGSVSAAEIDRINILEATKEAMLLAIGSLDPPADHLLIDAILLKKSPLAQRSIIRGDSISASIAAASILAKTYRDALMAAYDREFPQYGFASHKGYGSAFHLDAIRTHGPCPLHRRTFRGVVV